MEPKEGDIYYDKHTKAYLKIWKILKNNTYSLVYVGISNTPELAKNDVFTEILHRDMESFPYLINLRIRTGDLELVSKNRKSLKKLMGE